jgi:hypothetical protein
MVVTEGGFMSAHVGHVAGGADFCRRATRRSVGEEPVESRLLRRLCLVVLFPVLVLAFGISTAHGACTTEENLFWSGNTSIIGASVAITFNSHNIDSSCGANSQPFGGTVHLNLANQYGRYVETGYERYKDGSGNLQLRAFTQYRPCEGCQPTTNWWYAPSAYPSGCFGPGQTDRWRTSNTSTSSTTWSFGRVP